jgi:asparagine synthase (glutamine-hydrolysing)
MAVQFGIWNFNQNRFDPRAFDSKQELLARYGPDGEGTYKSSNVTVLYRCFHTTAEVDVPGQPYVSPTGSVFAWDGRLDNRDDLAADLGLPFAAPDVEIVSQAYHRWQDECLWRLIGDWAISIWNPVEKSLLLAKDHIGTRHLYYFFHSDGIVWSTLLEPLVGILDDVPKLDLEFIAGWLGFGPASDRSPYTDVKAVPACHYLKIQPGRTRITKYWDFDPRKRIFYNLDSDYEEHFRLVFGEAVRRRLRSNRPVLAELSGGMDSASIVCTADKLISEEPSAYFSLDTISYYSDSEPNWNEQPFFSLVETKRGRIGRHIDVNSGGVCDFVSDSDFSFYGPTSGSVDARIGLLDSLSNGGYRVLLSGIGGDEILGGVPTQVPELADLFVGLQVRRFLRQLNLWALAKRQPFFHLLSETLRSFLPGLRSSRTSCKLPPAWLDRAFTNQYRSTLAPNTPRLKVLGSLPSFQINMTALEVLRSQVSCFATPLGIPYERRYPYLDRDLLEFAYAIPREQLVRPRQRKSLMRRAMRGIVPDAVLERKRKAFMSYAPFYTLRRRWNELLRISQAMQSEVLGIVNVSEFLKSARDAYQNKDVFVTDILRTCALENWLHNFKSLEDIKANARSRNVALGEVTPTGLHSKSSAS